jgi:predicted ATPase
MQGEVAAGLAPLRDVVAAQQYAGVKLQLPLALAQLAEVYGQAGQVEQALGALDEALATVAATGERWLEAELHRLRGEALLARAPADEAAAEGHFRRALAITGEQEAKWWELRAATSLARLWQRQGKAAAACALLAPVYDWFTEGFDTPDVQAARALLATLA